jgi:hypothetical protein
MTGHSRLTGKPDRATLRRWGESVMDPWRKVSTQLLLTTLILLLLVACGGEPEGERLLKDRCLQCHGIRQIDKGGKTADQWRMTVERMVLRGAELDETEQDTLIQYLAETYP